MEQGYGSSEEIIGRRLAQGGRRDRIVLATKVYQPMGTGPNDRRLSAYHIRNELRHTDRNGTHPREQLMARVFITGSADGLGRAAAETLLDDGHEVVVHARNRDRLMATRGLVDRGAAAVVGDLSDLQQTRAVAAQVNELGGMDAVIHNAGVYTGPHVLPVNIVAPYLLTALIDRPQRVVYLSSGEHRSGRASLTSIDWNGPAGRYADSKLFVTTLAVALGRIWPDTFSNAVDPGWVPTKMGGPGAPDDLRLGHLTQEWLATSEDPDARSSGGYWHHQRRIEPHPAVHDRRFQDRLLDDLARFTATRLG
jgi:NAD(P)-dependent dehydrogenase (short-subunit alcohol dehydrogenase family)